MAHMNSIGIFLLALIGFIVSWYIFYKKQRHEKLVCFLDQGCNRVVESKYNSLFFGIPNERIGMVYYASVMVFAILVFGGTEIFTGLLLTASALATLSSLVLLFIQAFVLKQWCEYCLTSAVASIAIFVLSLLIELNV